MRRIALLATAALFSAACLGSDFADSVDGTWQLESGTVDGEPIAPIASHPITITFEGDQVGGTASCNQYGGSFDLDGSSISLGELAMTEMACSPEETMTAESLYATGLTRADTISIDSDLTLSGDGVEMRFSRLEPVANAELTGATWVLESLVTADAVSSTVADSRATLEFHSDGAVMGDTGCRPFSGEYVTVGAEIQLTELAADGNQCEPHLAAQDSHVLSALEGPFRVEIEGDRMTTWATGDIGLIYIAQD